MGAFLTVNGLEVVAARISLPRWGVWCAELAIDGTEVPAGQCTLELGDGPLTLKGSLARGAVSDGSVAALVLGGAGGLSRVAEGKHYRQTPLRIPLEDLLQVAGEALASSSDAGVLSQTLAHWTRLQGPSGLSLGRLVESVEGLVWRILTDGTLWVGKEVWGQAPAFEFDALPGNPLADTATLSSLAPSVLPGQTFQGRHVSYVEHLIEESGVRSIVWFEGAA
jgi:hypothetical protein